jgi:hypothetical protein
LWARRSEMLAPLIDLVGECGQTKVTKENKTKKKPWHWDEVHQKAFNAVKTTIARDVVLAYPDFSKVFEIYTDASATQLGSMITQDNWPIEFFSRKLTGAQQKYSVTEVELLAIVETLKEFKGILWGQRTKVYTDHQNLIRDALGLTSDRVHRWRLILEEYSPEIVYIKGIHNTVADAISRLNFDSSNIPKNKKEQRKNWMAFTKCWSDYNDSPHSNDANHIVSMNHVFATHTDEEEFYHLTIREIAEAQIKDKSLKNNKTYDYR